MRMTPQKLSRNTVNNTIEIKGAHFSPQLTVENHLKQHITQLLSDMRQITLLNGIYQLVTFL
jgi:hypothetical protein